MTLDNKISFIDEYISDTSNMGDVSIFTVLQNKVDLNLLEKYLNELYFFVKEFPIIISFAKESFKFKNNKIYKLLKQYEEEEYNHELFIEKTINNFNFILKDNPSNNTKKAISAMKSLLSKTPYAIFPLAQKYESTLNKIKEEKEILSKITKKQNISRNGFDPYLEHMIIDEQLGHSKILKNNKELLFEKMNNKDLCQLLITFNKIDCVMINAFSILLDKK